MRYDFYKDRYEASKKRVRNLIKDMDDQAIVYSSLLYGDGDTTNKLLKEEINRRCEERGYSNITEFYYRALTKDENVLRLV